MDNIRKEVINNDSPDIGKRINPVPVPPVNIGIDTDNEFYSNIVEAGEANTIDISQINSFSQISNTR